MIQEIDIPSEVGVITIRECVLFPQAMMPLFIFEPRYREMLADALSRERIFAVAALDEKKALADEASEAPCSIVGVGMVRACKKNPDGTANLILQGLRRVRIDEILTETPYRRARISPVESTDDGDPRILEQGRAQILRLIEERRSLGAGIPKEVIDFLRCIDGEEAMLDLSIYSLCGSGRMKQKLLETLSVEERFRLFEGYLQHEIAQQKLMTELKGNLEDDDIKGN